MTIDKEYLFLGGVLHRKKRILPDNLLYYRMYKTETPKRIQSSCNESITSVGYIHYKTYEYTKMYIRNSFDRTIEVFRWNKLTNDTALKYFEKYMTYKKRSKSVKPLLKIGADKLMNKFKNSSEYHKHHRCCPQCFCTNISQTLFGYVWRDDVEYVDSNEACCGNCKWIGIVHDLVSPEEMSQIGNGKLNMKLNEFEMEALLRIADLMLTANPDWRQGQTLFNALFELYPDIANSIRSDPQLDPFYNDENIGNLLRYLKEPAENTEI